MLSFTTSPKKNKSLREISHGDNRVLLSIDDDGDCRGSGLSCFFFFCFHIWLADLDGMISILNLSPFVQPREQAEIERARPPSFCATISRHFQNRLVPVAYRAMRPLGLLPVIEQLLHHRNAPMVEDGPIRCPIPSQSLQTHTHTQNTPRSTWELPCPDEWDREPQQVTPCFSAAYCFFLCSGHLSPSSSDHNRKVSQVK